VVPVRVVFHEPERRRFHQPDGDSGAADAVSGLRAS
jgi:hypothetical protein